VLSVRRKFVNKFEDCLLLIRKGNEKPFFAPRTSFNSKTTFPELSAFRRLARLEAAAAELALADGQNSSAISYLEDGFTFTDHVSSGPLVSRLASIGSSSVIFAALGRHWQQLSVPDAEELSRFFADRLNQVPSFVQTFAFEENLTEGTLSELRDNPSRLMELDGAPEFGDSLKSASPAQVVGAVDQAIGDVHSMFQGIEQALNGPEDAWMNLAEKAEKDPALSGASLASKLGSAVMPDFSQAVIAEERQRTRLRIAYLTTRAIRFKWEAGKLPNRIEDFATQDERRDPSSKGFFGYLKERDWFRIVRNTRSDEVGDVRIGPPPRTAEQEAADALQAAPNRSGPR
jgi:hypothetical protein